MAMSPEKIIMFSLPESEPDSASPSPSPVLTQNEEAVPSKEISPINPASPFQNPNLSPNQEAHCNEKPLGDPSPSLAENPNSCPDRNKEPVEETLETPNIPQNQEEFCDEMPLDDPSSSFEKNLNPCTELNKGPVEKPLENPLTCSENQSHGAEERNFFPHLEEEAEMAGGKDNATAAASTVARKLPAWASNRRAEDEVDMGGKSETQMGKKGNDLPRPNNLQEVIEAFSGDFDWKRYADMDLLEVAEMKGVVFENPSWWPPEGFPDSV